MKVASMRYDGYSWSQCGEVVYKPGKDVSKDLKEILNGYRKVERPRRFPTLRKWMIENDVSAKKLARAVNYSYGEIKSFMVAEAGMETLRAVSNYTGIDYNKLRKEFYDVKMGRN